MRFKVQALLSARRRPPIVPFDAWRRLLSRGHAPKGLQRGPASLQTTAEKDATVARAFRGPASPRGGRGKRVHDQSLHGRPPSKEKILSSPHAPSRALRLSMYLR